VAGFGLLGHTLNNRTERNRGVEKLVGNLAGYYSRRINIQPRMIYRIDSDQRVVHVLRMWTHCE